MADDRRVCLSWSLPMDSHEEDSTPSVRPRAAPRRSGRNDQLRPSQGPHTSTSPEQKCGWPITRVWARIPGWVGLLRTLASDCALSRSEHCGSCVAQCVLVSWKSLQADDERVMTHTHRILIGAAAGLIVAGAYVLLW